MDVVLGTAHPPNEQMNKEGRKGRRGAGERESEGYRSIRARTSVLTAGTAPLRISLLVLVVNLAPFLAKKSALNGPKVTHLLQQRVPACSSGARAPLSRVRRTVRAGHTLCKCIVSSLSLSRHPGTTHSHFASARDGGVYAQT